ncbi:MAG: isoaspartyl peptidase/L-asparaginase [Ignavibacteriaceae bacterium]|nr:isoaspartyl peptidase/L-asparaginase [Ignavibacteriaceae bacterium]
MRLPVLIALTVIIITSTIFYRLESSTSSKKRDYVLVIHGGAGFVANTEDKEKIEAVTNGIRAALELGNEMLKNGAKSIDVIEAVITILENDSTFNSGRGAVLSMTKEAELDASIMDGSNLNAGAVGNVRIVKNPIKAARSVMDKTNHVLLVGEGAEQFAISQNLDIVENSYFVTQQNLNEWEQRAKLEKGGTVGAVAMDKYGNLAAGTSTGGMMRKMHGRIGDSPIIGAGTYANNNSCAISATGWGEKYIKNAAAFNVHALMTYKNLSLNDAMKEVMYKILDPKDGGMIAIDKNGNYSLIFTTQAMSRGIATSDGIFEIKIWE